MKPITFTVAALLAVLIAQSAKADNYPLLSCKASEVVFANGRIYRVYPSKPPIDQNDIPKAFIVNLNSGEFDFGEGGHGEAKAVLGREIPRDASGRIKAKFKVEQTRDSQVGSGVWTLRARWSRSRFYEITWVNSLVTFVHFHSGTLEAGTCERIASDTDYPKWMEVLNRDNWNSTGVDPSWRYCSDLVKELHVKPVIKNADEKREYADCIRVYPKSELLAY